MKKKYCTSKRVTLKITFPISICGKMFIQNVQCIPFECIYSKSLRHLKILKHMFLKMTSHLPVRHLQLKYPYLYDEKSLCGRCI